MTTADTEDQKPKSKHSIISINLLRVYQIDKARPRIDRYCSTVADFCGPTEIPKEKKPWGRKTKSHAM
jgi:hypothetical protein